MVDARSLSRPFQADRTARARLKRETDDLHRQAEAALDASDWLASITTYATLLESWQGLLRIFETSLAPFIGVEEAEFAIGSRLRWLVEDLSLLGRTAGAGILPPSMCLAVSDRAAAFGCLYVLEGSALGGTVLAKRAADRLGSATPTRFMTGRGKETGPRWLTFLSLLDRVLDSDAAIDRAVRTARQSFALVASRLTSD